MNNENKETGLGLAKIIPIRMSSRGALMNFIRREAENPATNLKTGWRPNARSISTARLSIAADGVRL